MTNLLLRKTGLVFDKSKTGNALKAGTFALVDVIETKTNQAKLQRKKIAGELEGGLKHHAAIDVEQLIRQEFEISAYDTLRRQCNTLADRLDAVASQKQKESPPPDMKEALLTLMWAADKGAEVPEELMVVKAQLTKKYGKSFAERAQTNDGDCVSKIVFERLLYQNYPSPELVEDYIKTITEEIGIADKSGATGTEKATPTSNRKIPVSVKAPLSTEIPPETRKPSPLKHLKEAPKETFSPTEPMLVDADFSSKTSLASKLASSSVETAKAVMAAP